MIPTLVLCHNATTAECLDSLIHQDVPVDLLVIDNDSTERVRDLLAGYPQAHVLRYRPQIGVSEGWDVGLSHFFSQGAEAVWVVNDDIVCRPDTLRELMSDGGQFVTAVGVGSMNDLEKPFVKAVRPHPDFSCFLIRRECWQMVGPFDQAMKFYASDCDYHIRMFKRGIEAYTIGLPFYHVASGTIKYSSPEEAQAIHRQADRDREAFARKWGFRIGSKEYGQIFEK